MRRALALGLLILLCACELVHESDAAKEDREENGWWDKYFGRTHDESETCGYWGRDCKKSTTTNEYGW